MASVIAVVHSGQRRAATGMLIVHSGQSLVVAALFRSSSWSRRLTGRTRMKKTTGAEIRKDKAAVTNWP